MSGPSDNGFRERLCCTLVADALDDVEAELFVIKSARFLTTYSWPNGKRLRPIVFLLSNLSVQLDVAGRTTVDRRKARIAAAIETLHEASLVHDDLVDRSAVRRSKPTIHAASGDGLAVLIGDYLVFRGLKLILDAAESQRDILLAQELTSTGLEIAHGEIEQLDRFVRRDQLEDRMSMDEYVAVISKKTAAFFAGCAEVGAALAGAERGLRASYRRFGRNLGIVFQMVDDVMDVAGDPSASAKTLKNNLGEGTVTLPMIHAYEQHPDHAGLRRLASGKRLSDALAEDTYRLLATAPVLERCRESIEHYTREAGDALRTMPSNIFRLGLEDVLDYVRRGPWGGLEPALDGDANGRGA